MPTPTSQENMDKLIKTVKSNTRMILAVQVIGRDNKEWCNRDDLWAISTEELTAIKAHLAQARTEAAREALTKLKEHKQYVTNIQGVVDKDANVLPPENLYGHWFVTESAIDKEIKQLSTPLKSDGEQS